MRVVITGSRDVGSDPNIARRIISDALFDLVVRFNDYPVIVHGAARGVDRIAGQEALKAGLIVEEHPADWDTYGKSAGFIRNAEMLASGCDLVLAFWDGKSRGTKHTIDLAKGDGIPVEVIRL